MPKLTDQITSEGLLALIRTGALKNELVKQYRTSDQELATMLLPLYRQGYMTKEEFNDFFKGVPLTGVAAAEHQPRLQSLRHEKPAEPASEAEEEQEAEAPPEPRSSKLRFFSRKPEPSRKPPREEAPNEPFPYQPVVHPGAETVPTPRDAGSLAGEEAPPQGSADRFSGPSLLIEVDEKVARPAAGAPEPGLEPPERKPVETLPTAILATVLARLDSIDSRLSRIEAKLDLS
jgi:hypothetical protein